MQPLDQGIILSAKRRYKKKLAERYLTCVENNKDANSLLKALDIVQATNMIAASWRETSSTIIQNCFRKAGFKHHAVDPASEIEEDPLFIYYVDTVDTTFTEYTRFNGTYVDTVDMIKLQCKS